MTLLFRTIWPVYCRPCKCTSHFRLITVAFMLYCRSTPQAELTALFPWPLCHYTSWHNQHPNQSHAFSKIINTRPTLVSSSTASGTILTHHGEWLRESNRAILGPPPVSQQTYRAGDSSGSWFRFVLQRGWGSYRQYSEKERLTTTYLITYLLTYLRHGAESFLRS